MAVELSEWVFTSGFVEESLKKLSVSPVYQLSISSSYWLTEKAATSQKLIQLTIFSPFAKKSEGISGKYI